MGSIRVLHVFSILNLGGAETMIMNLYRKIDKNRIQFDFVVHGNSCGVYESEIISMGGHVYHAPKFMILNFCQYMIWWIRFYRTHPDYVIIHGHYTSLGVLYLYLAKKYTRITIAHCHYAKARNIKLKLISLITSKLKSVADYEFACSMNAGKFMFGEHFNCNSNAYILKNAIDINRFVFSQRVRENTRNLLAIEDKLVIGHIGRIDVVKNHEFLLEIFEEIHYLRPDSVLLLVGDGNLFSHIKNIVEKKGLSDSVIMLGMRTDVNELLQAMDVFVFPSLYEGLGLCLIEAQAAGLRCFTSKTVPNEVNITNLVKFLDLNNSAKCWAKEILNELEKKEYDRRDKINEIFNSGYDIITTVHWLESFYINIYQNQQNKENS